MAGMDWILLERAENGWKSVDIASSAAKWFSRKKTVATAQHINTTKIDAAAQ